MRTREETAALIDSVVRQLTARLLEEGDAESVRVFVTYRAAPGIFASHTNGNGNIYAQLGQVREWLQEQEQFVKTRSDILQQEAMGIHICRDGKCKHAGECVFDADEEEDDDECTAE